MIYLIGGAPRLGKSVLARRLSKETGIPWLSTDVLRQVVAAYTPKKERNRKWLIGNETWRAQLSSGQRKRIQLLEARALEPAVVAFVKEHFYTRDDIILEGVHLLPKTIRKLMSLKIAKRRIRAVVFVDQHADHILTGMQRNTSHNDWLRDTSTNNKQKVADVAALLSDYFVRETGRNRIPVVQKTDHFEKDIAAALRILLKR